MELKDYQNKAVARLLERGTDLLRQSGDKKMVFKSPTGSGKTAITAEFLAHLADADQVPPFASIWIAPRKLHKQSKDKLEKYYENSRALECLYFYELSNQQISDREILFLNWESVRQEKNIIIRENERDMYLDKVVENTKEAGRAVVLIIDESHSQAKTDHANALIENIAPKLTVEISATPMIQNPDELVPVTLDAVKAEGMIKESVILNDGIRNKLQGHGIKPSYAGRADDFVLKQALAKRNELATAFYGQGANINPLLCIQLPDRRTQQEDNVKTNALRTLAREGITEANGKLAVYLSGEYVNLENIARNDNDVEVMIFKQAIALGWDCPRAHILVLFRDWRSVTFSVQTLGRIMRMPEPETGYYTDEILNHGYVYTNLTDVSINEDVASGYVVIYTARRADNYMPLKLPSVHSARQREKTRLSPLFIDCFLRAAIESELKKKINTRDQQVHTDFISDFESKNIDALRNNAIQGNVAAYVSHDEDLQKLFDYFVRDNLSPYYPDDRSIGRVKTAIYEFFGSQLAMDYADDFRKILNIVLSESNIEHFAHILEIAKDKYKTETKQRKEPLQKTPEWEIAESVNYGENHAERATNKSVMQPFYAARSESSPEKAFINRLENSSKVRWWYKNGESESMYFAVPYSKYGEEHPFYVDFIIQFASGAIGLYDPKSGITLRDATEKNDGLLAYIRAQNKEGNNLTGGIVAPIDEQNHSGGWKIYKGQGANIGDPGSPGWEPLDL